MDTKSNVSSGSKSKRSKKNRKRDQKSEVKEEATTPVVESPQSLGEGDGDCQIQVIVQKEPVVKALQSVAEGNGDGPDQIAVNASVEKVDCTPIQCGSDLTPNLVETPTQTEVKPRKKNRKIDWKAAEEKARRRAAEAAMDSSVELPAVHELEQTQQAVQKETFVDSKREKNYSPIAESVQLQKAVQEESIVDSKCGENYWSIAESVGKSGETFEELAKDGAARKEETKESVHKEGKVQCSEAKEPHVAVNSSPEVPIADEREETRKAVQEEKTFESKREENDSALSESVGLSGETVEELVKDQAARKAEKTEKVRKERVQKGSVRLQEETQKVVQEESSLDSKREENCSPIAESVCSSVETVDDKSSRKAKKKRAQKERYRANEDLRAVEQKKAGMVEICTAMMNELVVKENLIKGRSNKDASAEEARLFEEELVVFEQLLDAGVKKSAVIVTNKDSASASVIESCVFENSNVFFTDSYVAASGSSELDAKLDALKNNVSNTSQGVVAEIFRLCRKKKIIESDYHARLRSLNEKRSALHDYSLNTADGNTLDTTESIQALIAMCHVQMDDWSAIGKSIFEFAHSVRRNITLQKVDTAIEECLSGGCTIYSLARIINFPLHADELSVTERLRCKKEYEYLREAHEDLKADYSRLEKHLFDLHRTLHSVVRDSLQEAKISRNLLERLDIGICMRDIYQKFDDYDKLTNSVHDLLDNMLDGVVRPGKKDGEKDIGKSPRALEPGRQPRENVCSKLEEKKDGEKDIGKSPPAIERERKPRENVCIELEEHVEPDTVDFEIEIVDSKIPVLQVTPPTPSKEFPTERAAARKKRDEIVSQTSVDPEATSEMEVEPKNVGTAPDVEEQSKDECDFSKIKIIALPYFEVYQDSTVLSDSVRIRNDTDDNLDDCVSKPASATPLVVQDVLSKEVSPPAPEIDGPVIDESLSSEIALDGDINKQDLTEDKIPQHEVEKLKVKISKPSSDSTASSHVDATESTETNEGGVEEMKCDSGAVESICTSAASKESNHEEVDRESTSEGGIEKGDELASGTGVSEAGVKKEPKLESDSGERTGDIEKQPKEDGEPVQQYLSARSEREHARSRSLKFDMPPSPGEDFAFESVRPKTGRAAELPESDVKALSAYLSKLFAGTKPGPLYNNLEMCLHLLSVYPTLDAAAQKYVTREALRLFLAEKHGWEFCERVIEYHDWMHGVPTAKIFNCSYVAERRPNSANYFNRRSGNNNANRPRNNEYHDNNRHCNDRGDNRQRNDSGDNRQRNNGDNNRSRNENDHNRPQGYLNQRNNQRRNDLNYPARQAGPTASPAGHPPLFPPGPPPMFPPPAYHNEYVEYASPAMQMASGLPPPCPVVPVGIQYGTPSSYPVHDYMGMGPVVGHMPPPPNVCYPTTQWQAAATIGSPSQDVRTKKSKKKSKSERGSKENVGGVNEAAGGGDVSSISSCSYRSSAGGRGNVSATTPEPGRQMGRGSDDNFVPHVIEVAVHCAEKDAASRRFAEAPVSEAGSRPDGRNETQGLPPPPCGGGVRSGECEAGSATLDRRTQSGSHFNVGSGSGSGESRRPYNMKNTWQRSKSKKEPSKSGDKTGQAKESSTKEPKDKNCVLS